MDNTNKDFKKKLLDTFAAFDKFCSDHNIHYFASGGSLIGAVRHKGLIPWDDDIDVVMLREDYEKFLSYRGKVDGHYDIVCDKDEGYWLLAMAKFVDTDTTLWEFEEYPCVTGIYIDIFPLFECNSKDAVELKNKYDNLANKMHRALRCHSIKKVISLFCHGHLLSLKEVLKDIFYYIPNYNSIKIEYDRFFDEIKKSKGDVYISYEGDYGEREILGKEYFERSVRLQFEGFEISASAEFDKLLTHWFGDYMQLPPVEKQKSHHPHYFVDLSRRWSIEEIRQFLKTSK